MRIEKVQGPVRKRAAGPARRPAPVPEVTRRGEPGTQGSAAKRDAGPVRPGVALIFSLGASAALFAFFLLSDKGLLQERRHRQRVAELQTEVAALFQENEKLEGEVTSLRTDPAAAEKVAREELNLVRPGDVVLILPKGWQEQAAKSAQPAPTAKPASQAPLGSSPAPSPSPAPR